ncbi:MAG: WYL domain-containing protein [Caldilineaceae bacterium]|nr:WYL domain-containing protein [Caldilineaceae bacterium]
MASRNPNGDEDLKRTGRILEIIHLIAIRPRQYRAKDFAERWEITDRMIKKDLELIRHRLRLSLRSSPQGYYFEEVPKLPAIHYPFTEALSLLQSTQVARHISGIDSADLAAAVARLESLFPPEFRPLLRALTQRPQRTVQRDHRQQMLRLLNQALLEGRKLEIVYETASRDGDISRRVVHPYHIMLYVRSWQLIAYCEKRQAIIMFKVDRIHEATLLDEGYTISSEFNAEDYMGNSWGVMRGEGLTPEEIELHFDSHAGRWVAEEFWHSSQDSELQPDGSLIFRLKIAITPEFVNWLLYYGSRVEVKKPLHLRQTVAEEHRQAAELYL